MDSFVFSFVKLTNAECIRYKLLALCDEENEPMSGHGYQSIHVLQVRSILLYY